MLAELIVGRGCKKSLTLRISVQHITQEKETDKKNDQIIADVIDIIYLVCPFISDNQMNASEQFVHSLNVICLLYTSDAADE